MWSSVVRVSCREKRTDVVKRYEEEIESLRKIKVDLELQLTEASTERKKNETKIGELKGRSDTLPFLLF